MWCCPGVSHAQALTAATASATEHSGRAEVEHARLAELEALLEAKHKELEEAQVGGSKHWLPCSRGPQFFCWGCLVVWGRRGVQAARRDELNDRTGISCLSSVRVEREMGNSHLRASLAAEDIPLNPDQVIEAPTQSKWAFYDLVRIERYVFRGETSSGRRVAKFSHRYTQQTNTRSPRPVLDTAWRRAELLLLFAFCCRSPAARRRRARPRLLLLTGSSWSARSPAWRRPRRPSTRVRSRGRAARVCVLVCVCDARCKGAWRAAVAAYIRRRGLWGGVR